VSSSINYQKNLDYLKESIRIAEFQIDIVDQILEVSQVCINSINNSGKILFCGNGGSASDSQHLAAEIVVRFKNTRKPLPAIALTTDTSIITSIGNDFGFEEIFSRQIEAIGNSEDVLIAFSTSGKSANIIKALTEARNKKITTITFTGPNIDHIVDKSDFIISIPSEVTGVIQQSHITIGQLITMNIENNLLNGD
jgi:D-sedoheptulose 7-phosphate isomerase|tara:strand:+ start:143 stop:730 length:588 start_codon:yes stop_codon:yes gene_type:complete